MSLTGTGYGQVKQTDPTSLKLITLCYWKLKMQVFLQIGIIIDKYIRHAVLELILGQRQYP
jgi:hypothetical protein